MSFRKLVALSACGAGLYCTNVVVAQQAPQNQPRGNQVQVQAGAGQLDQQTIWKNNDQLLANCVAIQNQAEIAIAKNAQEKAKNKDVKEFAQMLVKDHQAFLQKLQRFAPETTREGYLNDRNETASNDQKSSSKVQPAGGEVRNANGQIQQTAATQNAGSDAGQPINIIQLHREIAEECIRSAKSGMSKKDGKEFDECFVGFQIAAHAEMKNKLTVFQRHVSGDLKQILSDGLETTEKHLKKAEDLMKDLSDRDSKGDSTAKSK